MEDPLPLDDPMLPLGDPMRGRLRFLSSLARGTFGQVLLYYDEEYQEQVAIKFIDMSKTKFAIQCVPPLPGIPALRL